MDKLLLAIIILAAAFSAGYGSRQGEINVLKNAIEAADVKAKTNERIWNETTRELQESYEGDIDKLRAAYNGVFIVRPKTCPTAPTGSPKTVDETPGKPASGRTVVEVDTNGCVEDALQVLQWQKWVTELKFPMQK